MHIAWLGLGNMGSVMAARAFAAAPPVKARLPMPAPRQDELVELVAAGGANQDGTVIGRSKP